MASLGDKIESFRVRLVEFCQETEEINIRNDLQKFIFNLLKNFIDGMFDEESMLFFEHQLG